MASVQNAEYKGWLCSLSSDISTIKAILLWLQRRKWVQCDEKNVRTPRTSLRVCGHGPQGGTENSGGWGAWYQRWAFIEWDCLMPKAGAGVSLL